MAVGWNWEDYTVMTRRPYLAVDAVYGVAAASKFDLSLFKKKRENLIFHQKKNMDFSYKLWTEINVFQIQIYFCESSEKVRA